MEYKDNSGLNGANINLEAKNPETDNDKKVDVVELIQKILENFNPICELDALSKFLHAKDNRIEDSFESDKITSRFIELLSSTLCSNKAKIFILECISSFWYYADNSERYSVWIARNLVDAVISMIDIDDRDLVPVAYITLANFAAIDKETSCYLFEKNVVRKLLNYLRSWTSPHHTKAGLFLASKLLCFRNEEIYCSMFEFIPCFRCHLMNNDPEVRNKASECLIKLCEFEPAIEECINCEVPESIYNCIVGEPAGFVEQAFKLIHVFLETEARSIFVKEEFIDSIGKILAMSTEEKSANEFNLGDIFLVLISLEADAKEMMENMNIFQLAAEYLQSGYSTIKLHACVFLALVLSNCRKSIKNELIDQYQTVDAICDIISLLNSPEHQKIVFTTIWSLTLSDFDRLEETFYDEDLLENIDNMESEFSPEVREITDNIKAVFAEHDDGD